MVCGWGTTGESAAACLRIGGGASGGNGGGVGDTTPGMVESGAQSAIPGRHASSSPDSSPASSSLLTCDFSVEGLRLAQDRGILRFGKVCGFRSWIVTDTSGRLAQARRVDGELYPAFRDVGERKSHTLAGSKQNWPLGITEAGRFQNVLFVEGAPDLLAIHCFIAWARGQNDTCAVAVLGAGNRMPEQILTVLEEKLVRIFLHQDEAGKRALWRWTGQLIGAGAKVDAYDFKGLRKADGSPVEDLNDLLRAPQESDACKEVCIP
jgi:hypothetical protein